MPEHPDEDTDLQAAETLIQRLLAMLENESLGLLCTAEVNDLASWLARRTEPRCVLCDTPIVNPGFGRYCSEAHAGLGFVLAGIEDQAHVGACLECHEPVEDKRTEFCCWECAEDYEMRQQSGGGAS